MTAESRCVWMYDGKKDYWLTNCGERFNDNDLRPTFKFCPICGEKLVRFAPTEDE